jgi:hypothetical protein
MEWVLGAISLFVSLFSLAACVMLFQNRMETSDVISKVRTLELEVADLVDRLQVWQRRDAARNRRMGGAASAELGGSEPDQHAVGSVPTGKGQLRAIARQRGLMP